MTLTNTQIPQIITLVEEWDWEVKRVAFEYHVSPSRVYQILTEYRRTGIYPVIHTRGPKPKVLTEREREIIIDAKKRLNLGTAALADYLRVKQGLHIGNNRIHEVLLEEGLTQRDPSKSYRRRPWVRYEREHSLSAVHMDWYMADDGATHVCVVIDDASRMILSGGEFREQTAEHSVSLLKEAYEKYQHISPIREVITDHGTQFYATNRSFLGETDHLFETFCEDYGITHILARVKHPQTNGKVERFFQTFRKNRSRFRSFNEFADWYNKIRPHMSLDWSIMETPEMAFYRKAVDIIRGNCAEMIARECEAK
ncbi:MAG TPA: DDE-type integrase/transposase/recombinase [Methanocorpusculum sp.]|nr:DDE-type integrase/transposase/recombinase [Methanocorpusculum sp.]